MKHDAAPGASKIIFVNRYYYPDQSASSQLLTDLASALAQSGFRVEVICSSQCYDDPHARLTARETVGGVGVRRVWTTRFGRNRLAGRALDYLTFYGAGGVALLRDLKPGDTVVAKTDPPLISLVAMVAARLKGAHLVNWLQDIFPEVASLLGSNPLPRPLDALLRRGRDASLRYARANVVLGERMRDKLESLGLAARQVHVIENWAEPGADPPKPVSSSLLRAELGLNDKFVVGYSGNLGRAHEYGTLLNAAQSLENDTDIVFLMIGGGAGMAQLSREAGARNLRNFRFLPYQRRDSLSDALAAADVHWVSLLPALEGLIVPSKFYGILAAARPLIFIGDPDGELARQIRAGACGAAVAIDDACELARLLSAWKADAELREKMGQAGYRRYQENFAAARAFDRWKRLL